MKRKKLSLVIICALLLCLAALREIGIFDVHLYKSFISTSQSFTKSHANIGQEEKFSYHLEVKHNQKILHSYMHTHGNLPKIEIEAVIKEPVYTGNVAMPLIKQFNMTYLCEFTTKESTGRHTVNGKIEGKVAAKIRGLCSRKKAKELAFNEAIKNIISYFQDQF